MKSKDTLQKVLNDFVFMDCRLADHPQLACYIYRQSDDSLYCVAAAGHLVNNVVGVSLPVSGSLTGRVLRERVRLYANDIRDDRKFLAPQFVLRESFRSYLGVPILVAKETLGVISIFSRKNGHFEEKHTGRALLLAGIAAYIFEHIERRYRISSPVSAQLGFALRKIREEIGLSQETLAHRVGTSRIALSRWEGGAPLPSQGPLYRWCEALRIVSPGPPTIVQTVDITPQLINALRIRPQLLSELSPSHFEKFVAERLDQMGFDVTLTGADSLRDGGIDLIAVPKLRHVGAFLLAGQVKHHHSNRKTDRSAVDRLIAWKDSPFRIGLLVTNTYFTKDALWLAAKEQNKAFLRLRNFDDLRRWIQGNFWSEEEWREIPSKIDLAPGITIDVPKVMVRDALDIWPLKMIKQD